MEPHDPPYNLAQDISFILQTYAIEMLQLSFDTKCMNSLTGWNIILNKANDARDVPI